uniref:Uncharacterized protein n=1 Tax=Cacopsylla melanoneura TaxID=428564 RepID=A0A8D8X431_9HEMI
MSTSGSLNDLDMSEREREYKERWSRSWVRQREIMKECFSKFEEMRRDSRFYFKTLHLIYLRLSIFSRLVRFVPPIKTTWSVKNRTFKRFPSISIVDFFFF